MSIYNEKPSWSDGRQITFRDSILLFIEAIHPGNDIFDETGERPVVPGALGTVAKTSDTLDDPVFLIHVSLVPPS